LTGLVDCAGSCGCCGALGELTLAVAGLTIAAVVNDASVVENYYAYY